MWPRLQLVPFQLRGWGTGLAGLVGMRPGRRPGAAQAGSLAWPPPQALLDSPGTQRRQHMGQATDLLCSAAHRTQSSPVGCSSRHPSAVGGSVGPAHLQMTEGWGREQGSWAARRERAVTSRRRALCSRCAALCSPPRVRLRLIRSFGSIVRHSFVRFVIRLAFVRSFGPFVRSVRHSGHSFGIRSFVRPIVALPQ